MTRQPIVEPTVDRTLARDLAADHGGEVYRFEDVPATWMFAETVLDPAERAVP